MLRTLRPILVGLLVGGMSLSACSSAETTRPRPGSSGVIPPEAPTVESSAPTEDMGPPTDVVSRLIQEALESDGSFSYEALVNRLGTPESVETESVANQYVQGQVDTLRTLVYTGIEALVYDVTNDTKSFLVRLSIFSTQYTTPEGIRVGLGEDRVVDELGPPTRRNASQGKMIYQESTPTPTSMVVRVQDGRVVQIDWEFYFT